MQENMSKKKILVEKYKSSKNSGQITFLTMTIFLYVTVFD